MAISKIKAAIRSNERLLSKKGVDEETKQAANRKLQGLTYSLNKAKEDELSRKMSTRYHKIKFIEKRKLVRLIKSKKNSPEKLLELRLKLNYIIHHPAHLKYISVLNKPSSDADVQARQSRLDHLKEKMEDGSISSTPETNVFNKKSNTTKGSKGGTSTSKRDDDSDNDDANKADNADDADDADNHSNLSNDDFFE